MSESQSVICQLNIVRSYDPQVQVGEDGIGEPPQVDSTGTGQRVTLRFADGAGELCPADAAYTLCLQGDGACHTGIAAELRAVPGDRVSGDNKCVILFVPGIEA